MAGSSAELELILKAKNLATGPISRVSGALRGVKGAAGGAGKAILGFAKIAAGIALVGVLALFAALGKATAMAAEEEVGIRKLDQALKANVKGYNGNREAIEKVIAKREKLAFSDGDLRDSLTKLVTKFGSVKAALHVQRVAMDVARLKGIDLGASTDLVSRAMSGNKKALKDLGIVMDEGATKHEILMAIQAKAEGQAKAYGKTQAGAAEAARIAMDDFMEDIGAFFLPIMAEVTRIIVADVIPAVKSIAKNIQAWYEQNKPLIDQILAFVGGALKVFIDTIGKVVEWLGKVFKSISDNKDVMNVLKTFARVVGDLFAIAWAALEKLFGFLGDVFKAISSNKTVMAVFKGVWDGIGDAIGIVIDVVRTVIDKLKDAWAWIQKVIGAGNALPGNAFPGNDSGRKGYAQGGWVGLRGPEVVRVGERGPEFVSTAHQSKGMGDGDSVTIKGVSKRELARIIDQQLYVQFQRAVPTVRRT